ncbi:MAG: prefoldin subunit [archaeon]
MNKDKDMKDNSGAVNAYKQQLMFITNQKQQMQFQSNILDSTIKELETTKEKKVYKGTGNIFISKNVEDVLKETKETKETIALRIKTLEKQENELVKKLNELTRTGDKPGKKNSNSDDDNVEGVA